MSVLEVRSISKAFGHVQALGDVSFILRAGEIVALLGDNGAGKSTLAKILAGDLRMSSGQLLVDGRAVSFGSPAEARAAGIEIVYQDLAVALGLDSAANFYLGRELTRGGRVGSALGLLDFRGMRVATKQRFDELGLVLKHPTAPLAELSGGERQLVAVARTLGWPCRIAILDEPTAALGIQRAAVVGDLIRAAAASGTALIVISHDLPRMLQIATRVIVLRLGQIVLDIRASEASAERVVAAMTGQTGRNQDYASA